MVEVPTGLNDLKAKVNKLDVFKLKTVLVDLKELSDVVSKEVSDGSTLIQTIQYNTDKQNFVKKVGDVESKISDVSGSVTTVFVNTRIGEVKGRIPDVSREHILDNIKTSSRITSSKYPIKYLQLFFVSTNFEMQSR